MPKDADLDTTFVCVHCTTEITVPSADRVGAVELVVDYGWEVTRAGAYCREHKVLRTRT